MSNLLMAKLGTGVATIKGHATMASNGLLLAGSYTKAITNIKNILTTVGEAMGAVCLVWGGISLAMAFKNQDNQGEHKALYTVVAGAMLVGIGAVVKALG